MSGVTTPMRNRWRELLWLCLALAAGGLLAVMQVRGGGNVASMPATNSVLLPGTTATLAPFQLTATLIVGQATRQASIPVTLPTRAFTTPATTLDAFELTATHIVGQATNAALAATDPFLITATYVVAQATAHAPTQLPTPTPLPTPNASQMAEMRAVLLAELEAAAGFSHPVFDELVMEYLSELPNDGGATAYDNYRRSGGVLSEISRIEFGDWEYVAITVYKTAFQGLLQSLLVFRHRNGSAQLLPFPPSQMDGGYYWSEAYVFNLSDYDWDTEEGYVERPLGFDDRNRNGLPDLAVRVSSGGNNGYGGMVLVEITEESRLIDIAPTPNDAIVREIRDINNDGLDELVAYGCIPHPFNDMCNYDRWFGIERYFGWDGERYVDISATLDADVYYPALSQFWDTFDETSTCVLPSLEMYDMLVAAYIRGELDAQWERLQPSLRWGGCSVSSLQDYRIHLSSLVQWVEQLPDIARRW
jgi:hypothetical protein